MKFYLCIDDTDNLDSIGTGTIAEQIREKLIEYGYGPCSLVTRHQLFIHEDIPYTSHNSSMCFCGEAPAQYLLNIIKIASHHLDAVAAEGSDPGLCVLQFDDTKDYKEVIDFGKAAKISVLTKNDAMQCAKINHLHLSEHGGTGQGIIGALAGVGLRIFGSDGEVKAALKNIETNQHFSVSQLKKFPELTQVIDLVTREPLDDSTEINICNRTKTVLYKNQYVLFVVKAENGRYQTIPKSEIRKMGESFYE
ncbi:hypothetical protein GH810_07400 [Acetobacterium paludosum]|uniref:Uncharacterized protein n=1 Tax=Acetobacterium paludosum TaxID=52693 RepID=A0A923HY41_9FIRM|nr:hypothetical protein [Acetobacterium paludosum]MBC3888131.1 hypothetical protein [Acetobacterium paludosum]